MIKRLMFLVVLLVSAVVVAQEETQDPIIFRDSIPSSDSLAFETIVDDLLRPLFVTHAGDDTGRLFVVEQGGRIKVLVDGELTTFMDISNLVSPEANSQGYTERGLLGLAFHPEYAENGLFFVNYTDTQGDTVIARYQVSDNPDVADSSSANIIFTINQPYRNHNGGHMVFGSDGYLYVSLGDGGSAGDPLEAGQNPNILLGTIMRIDVNSETGYAIPEDNPFVNGGGSPEVWSFGWRNPWRFSFDRATGDMYIGDVGQNQWEEVNFESSESIGGLNYGWNYFEATTVYAGGGDPDAVVMPFAEYNHSGGNCSVTSGYIYRGDMLPDWQGVYFYGDFCSGTMWTAYRTQENEWVADILMGTNYRISSFGEDENGELYIVDYNGAVLRIIPAE